MDRVRELLRLKEQGYNQREMHRATGIARSCIQRYLGVAEVSQLTYQEAKELSDEALRERLQKKIPGRQRAEVTEPEFSQIHQELLSRKGVTLELLWQEWGQSAPQIYSYSTFCRRYREWAKTQRVTLRWEYEPGEKAFADYAGETLCYWDGEGRKCRVEIFVSTLAASNLIYCEASLDQSVLSWCNSNVRALEYFSGCPKLLVIDNLRSGISRSCRYEPELNRVFAEFGEHYALAIMPTRVACPRDKAKVEEAVQLVERWVLAPLRKQHFTSLSQMNSAVGELLEALNSREMRQYGCSRRELFERREKTCLRPLPERRFSPCQWKRARVHLDYHVEFQKHWYSVPYYLAKKDVLLRISESIVEIFYNNERVASHVRSSKEHRYSTFPAHLAPQHLAVKSRSAENFLSWASSVGEATKDLVQRMLDEARHPEQAYRSILGLQRLSKTFTPSRLERAAVKANLAHNTSQRFVRTLIEEELRVAPALESEPLTHKNIRGSSYFH